MKEREKNVKLIRWYEKISDNHGVIEKISKAYFNMDWLLHCSFIGSLSLQCYLGEKFPEIGDLVELWMIDEEGGWVLTPGHSEDAERFIAREDLEMDD